MTDETIGTAYRIEDLAHRSGATVRTIRAYQDRGLLPRPERRGRVNVYSDAHLARLRRIADLLDRGYTLASIGELLDAWDTGRGLAGVLGPAAADTGSPAAENFLRITRVELAGRFGETADEAYVADAVELGVLVPVPGEDGVYVVPSPHELSVAAELYAAGVPLRELADEMRELRGLVERIASRLLEFATKPVVTRFLNLQRSRGDEEPGEAADLVRRLQPLARQTVDAELGRVLLLFARDHVSGRRATTGVERLPAAPAGRTRPVHLPSATIRAVEALVGARHAAEFIALAAEHEVLSRALDALAAKGVTGSGVDERN